MTEFAVRGILLDIEGTTSSISYVYDVLFPYAHANVQAYLERHWTESSTRAACALLAKDAGFASYEEWLGESSGAVAAAKGDEVTRSHMIGKVVSEVTRLMNDDVKATGLKELQGLIWQEGYAAGTLRSHLFEDVPAALAEWTKAGLDLAIFSSGSITAQKVFFAHTECGDLLHFFKRHYDTTTGPKRETSTYAAIAGDMQMEPVKILFLSDVVAELAAASAAGMQTALVVRPGNPPANDVTYPVIRSFSEIKIT